MNMSQPINKVSDEERKEEGKAPEWIEFARPEGAAPKEIECARPEGAVKVAGPKGLAANQPDVSIRLRRNPRRGSRVIPDVPLDLGDTVGRSKDREGNILKSIARTSSASNMEGMI